MRTAAIVAGFLPRAKSHTRYRPNKICRVGPASVASTAHQHPFLVGRHRYARWSHPTTTARTSRRVRRPTRGWRLRPLRRPWATRNPSRSSSHLIRGRTALDRPSIQDGRVLVAWQDAAREWNQGASVGPRGACPTAGSSACRAWANRRGSLRPLGLAGRLPVGSLAENPRISEPVVEVQGRRASAGAAAGVEVGLRRPGTFGQVNAVVFQQRSFAVVDLRDRFCVVRHRAEVVALGLARLRWAFKRMLRSSTLRSPDSAS